jgi:putative ABC transport system permease protein
MTVLILLKTALRILLRHATRSLLTILGIMIGIASIVVTFSIGRGAEVRVKEQFASLGENAMYIIPENIVERGHAQISTSLVKLKMADLQTIKQECFEVDQISRGHNSAQKVEYSANSTTDEILGVDANWPEISDTKPEYGVFFTEHHVSRRLNIAVLSADMIFR